MENEKQNNISLTNKLVSEVHAFNINIDIEHLFQCHIFKKKFHIIALLQMGTKYFCVFIAIDNHNNFTIKSSQQSVSMSLKCESQGFIIAMVSHDIDQFPFRWNDSNYSIAVIESV